ncbi:MAG: M13 family metallopeptidase [Panacagrimonas sp.]
MNPRPTFAAMALTLCACGAQQKDANTSGATPERAAAAGAGIERANFDPAVRPQDDLYRAVNGNWLSRAQIPADKSNFGAFTELGDAAEKQVRGIIEEQMANATAIGEARKIADFYAAFMDEAHIETLGLAPIQPELAAVDALSERKALTTLMARLAHSGVSIPLLPNIHQDARDATRYVADFSQSGLSLPNRDFYLIDDDKFRGFRAALLKHIERMMTLAGLPEPAAAARTILALETRIATLQWDKVELRDPVKRYNPYPTTKLPELARALEWPAFLGELGLGALGSVIVSQPSYVTGLGRLIDGEPLESWKTYLRWQVLDARAPLLGKTLVDENFAFYGAVLNGIAENRPRWKRGVEAVEGALGDAVGKLYVERHFPADNKARMDVLVQNLIRAYGSAIDQLEWMSADTKKAAQEKLAKFRYKIGYPSRWRDYSKLEVRPGDLVGNMRRAFEFEVARDLAKLGGPIDREEWFMNPQTVNAYYNPEMNEIVFPAAILQPPFFDARADDAVNYGAIGAVIGHEISHGFDDKGSQYDGDGNLRMWWKAEDRAKFDALGTRLAAQYDRYEPVKGYTVNGKFTLGENIADLGGLTIAHRAWKLSLGDQPAQVIDGLSGEQRFFMGWSQAWRRLYREENLLNRLKTDPHSPSEYRCNGVVTNLNEFHAAFGLEQTDRLYLAPEVRIKIW